METLKVTEDQVVGTSNTVQRKVETRCLTDRHFCHVCFVQPFPRVEFGEVHSCMSLRDLQLVPNGSLVVKVVPSSVPSGQVCPDSNYCSVLYIYSTVCVKSRTGATTVTILWRTSRICSKSDIC